MNVGHIEPPADFFDVPELEQLDEDELVFAEMLLQADAARDDPQKFFEYVLLEEKSREPITVAAHQELLLAFIMAHPRCIIKLPVGHSKTYTTAGLAMWLLGNNPGMRGAIISATQAQAAKPVGMVRDYIENSHALHDVFPQLLPSQRQGDSWTMTELTVQRPFGIRDASLAAYGVDGALPGSRLSFILVDDILTRENTATPEARKKVYDFIQTTVNSRLDPKNTRFIVCNTPWHPEDAVAALEKTGMPCLTMRIDGEIVLTNTDWDHPGLRPQHPNSTECRLVAHDPDPGNTTPLWPETYPPEIIAEIRTNFLPVFFAQLFMCNARSDEDAICKDEYIEKCKQLGRALGMFAMVPRAPAGFTATITGIDIGIADNAKAGKSAYVTHGIHADGRQVLLDAEAGHYPADVIISKAIKKHEMYGSILVVENNAAQELVRQIIQKQDLSISVRAHTTGKEKANVVWGLPALFNDFAQGTYALPNNTNGVCEGPVQDFVDQCLYYRPQKHTGDLLMAAYFARALAKKMGLLRSPSANKGGMGADRGRSFLSR